MLTKTWLLAGLLCPATTVLACECSPDSFSPASSRAHIEQAGMIFKGTVQDIEIQEFDPNRKLPKAHSHIAPHDNPVFVRVNIRIDTLYKGKTETNLIQVYADTMTSCGTTIAQLHKQRFFMAHKYMGDYVLAGQCNSYITKQDKLALENAAAMKMAPSTTENTENGAQDNESKICSKAFMPLDTPPTRFPSRTALDNWAQNSSFGGGQTETLPFNGIQIVVVRRSFTSGITTSDVAVYLPNKDNSYSLKGHHPAVYDEIITQARPESLSFISKKCGQKLLELSIQDTIPDPLVAPKH